MKNRFQNLPFKFNLQRYSAADLIEEDGNVDIIPGCMRNFDAVGLCASNQVDP